MTGKVEDVEASPNSRRISGDEITQESATPTSLQSEAEKSNIVDWDGPNDPENPMNWSFFRKWFTVTLVSVVTFLK